MKLRVTLRRVHVNVVRMGIGESSQVIVALSAPDQNGNVPEFYDQYTYARDAWKPEYGQCYMCGGLMRPTGDDNRPYECIEDGEHRTEEQEAEIQFLEDLYGESSCASLHAEYLGLADEQFVETFATRPVGSWMNIEPLCLVNIPEQWRHLVPYDFHEGCYEPIFGRCGSCKQEKEKEEQAFSATACLAGTSCDCEKCQLVSGEVNAATEREFA